MSGVATGLVGREFEVVVGPVAHGGHCVAHVEGRVTFVRHGLPGERVRLVITGETSRILRADVVDVLDASPDRVAAPCVYAGDCGGCDFQHVDPEAQLRLLGSVVEDQLRRLAGIERSVVVEAVGPSALGWRTRVTYATAPGGRLGLRRHRSHDVVPVDRCLIAHDDLPPVLAQRWPARAVEAIVSSRGERLVVVDEPRGRLPRLPGVAVALTDGTRVAGSGNVVEEVRHRAFRVSGSGFWQVHPAAATTLSDVVLELADVRHGDAVADLYAGVGLFSVFLAERVGPEGSVYSVESDPGAGRDAKRNVHDLPQVRLVRSDVATALAHGRLPGSVDVVVLDPPRTGAKQEVPAIAALGPRRIVYVACDPAALARDLASFAERGYVLDTLRAFALFPMTHHVECVALLRRRPKVDVPDPEGS